MGDWIQGSTQRRARHEVEVMGRVREVIPDELLRRRDLDRVVQAHDRQPMTG